MVGQGSDGERAVNVERWHERLAELATRRERASAMGGAERVARHRARGRLTARERVELLADAGTFRELGPLVGGDVPADGLVCGWAAVEGRPVLVGSEDFTVLGGSVGPGNARKRYTVFELALQERCPVVFLLEGAGFRPEAASGFFRGPSDLLLQPRLSGRVPFVAAVLGSSAGHSAITAASADWTVMTPGASVFSAGPALVRDATGAEVGKEELGGPDVALAAGTVHNLASDDAEAMGLVRHYLSYFPSNAWSYAPTREGVDRGPRPLDELLEIIPVNGRRGYDVRVVARAIVDEGRVLEVQPVFGPSLCCLLAHLGGVPVGVVANQPSVGAGAIDRDAADKAAHFIDVCDAFHLPLVFLSDNPGIMCGTGAEADGVLRAAGRFLAAQAAATTVRLHVTLRKAFGFGGLVMNQSPSAGNSATFVLPGGTLGSMPARAGATVSGADAATAAVLADREAEASHRLAEAGYFDDVVDPRELRNELLRALRFALPRRAVAPEPAARVGIRP